MRTSPIKLAATNQPLTSHCSWGRSTAEADNRSHFSLNWYLGVIKYFKDAQACKVSYARANLPSDAPSHNKPPLCSVHTAWSFQPAHTLYMADDQMRFERPMSSSSLGSHFWTSSRRPDWRTLHWPTRSRKDRSRYEAKTWESRESSLWATGTGRTEGWKPRGRLVHAPA